MKSGVLFAHLLVALGGTAAAGQFQNLGFDDAKTNTFQYVQVGNDVVGFTDPADGLPGWTLGGPGYGGVNVTVDRFPTNAAGGLPILYDTRQTVYPVDGSFSFLLMSGAGLPQAQTISISQIGQVPADARSLHFLSFAGPAQFEINGSLTPVLYVPRSGSPDTPTFEDAYADITKYAGQTVTLQFAAVNTPGGPANATAGLDSIGFSPEAVPEPSTFGLLVFGLTLGVVARKHRRANSWVRTVLPSFVVCPGRALPAIGRPVEGRCIGLRLGGVVAIGSFAQHSARGTNLNWFADRGAWQRRFPNTPSDGCGHGKARRKQHVPLFVPDSRNSRNPRQDGRKLHSNQCHQ